jgi:hypothetical protein
VQSNLDVSSQVLRQQRHVVVAVNCTSEGAHSD